MIIFSSKVKYVCKIGDTTSTYSPLVGLQRCLMVSIFQSSACNFGVWRPLRDKDHKFNSSKTIQNLGTTSETQIKKQRNSHNQPEIKTSYYNFKIKCGWHFQSTIF